MRQKASLDIFNYWDLLRGAADAPLRTDISPASIRHILPDLFILQAGEDGAPRFRLAGTGICSLFGRELREESFASLWAQEQPGDAVKISEGVMAHVVPALIVATGYSAGGRQLPCEVILLPLRSSPTECDRLLGCLASQASAPWLTDDPIQCLVLDRSRILVPRAAPSDVSESAGPTTRSLAVAGERVAGAMRRVFGGRALTGAVTQ